MRLPKHILVPVDFSAPSRAALQYAIALARPLEAEVEVIHCYETPPMVAPDLVLTVPGKGPQTVDVWVKSEAERQMSQFMTEIYQPSQLVMRHAVVSGPARARILNYAKEHPCDLIVIGTHGRSGVSRVLMGSVAEAIVRSAPVPVLTVRNVNE